MHNMISYGKHSIDQNDIDAVVNVLQSDWLTCGPVIDQFESKISSIVNAEHVISCSNGTTALHLAFLALGIGVGDTVLVPAITFLASANAARYVGADVAFVDVDPCTGLMTAETLEEAIKQHKNKSLKAIVNVHLAGQCEDLKAIFDLARKYNLYVIEDAAHALGTVYIENNTTQHFIGSNAFSDLTTFSFHPVKAIAMGEGGAITTNDINLARKIRRLRSHGMIRDPKAWVHRDLGYDDKDTPNPWYYEMHELGYNYRISDINCALGLSQLNNLSSFKSQRTQIVSYYDQAFADNKILQPLKRLSCSDPNWHLYIVFIDFKERSKNRATVMNMLYEQGIGTQVHYIPLYKQPYYKNMYGNITLPGSEAYYSKCLTLPLYVGLKSKQLEYISDALR